MTLRNFHLFFVVMLFSLFFDLKDSRGNSKVLIQAIKSANHIILLRHSLAPGFGDPNNFKLNDCQTQRNLSKTGVKQAKDIGVFLRKNGIKNVKIFSSEWCRCKDTAKGLGLGNYKTLSLLNSFFAKQKNGPQQTIDLEKWLNKLSLKSTTILVTHQVNITAFTGYYPSEGEMVLVRRLKIGKYSFIGSIKVEKLL